MTLGVQDFTAIQSWPTGRPRTASRWHSSVQRVITHMLAHLEEKQSSDCLAEVAALSRFHFNRVFRRLTGIPPACFLAALRLERAKRLLLTTDISVTEVCFEVGYSSLGTFVSRFTQMVGVSPNVLRREAQILHGSDLRDWLDLRPAFPTRDARVLRGQVSVPNWFSGTIFVATYEDLVPHARPVACTTLTGTGRFGLVVPDGTFVVAAAAVRHGVCPATFLDAGLELRVASQPIFVAPGRDTPTVALTLRPTATFDPPILAPLPLMLATRARRLDAAVSQ